MSRLLLPALVVSIIGLVILAYVGPRLEPPRASIGDLSPGMLEKNVLVEGSLSRVHEFKGGSMILTLADDTGSVSVYLPYAVAAAVGDSLHAGDDVSIVGMVQVYEGSLELVVDDVEDVMLK